MTAAESSRLTPILDHIAAPRMARDLGGTWVGPPRVVRRRRGWLAGRGPNAVGGRVNGTADESLAVAGDHLGTVLERTPMRRGLVGWPGPTPTREDAVVWVWSHDNPHTDRQLTGITLRGVAGGVAVMGVTLER